MNRSSRIVPALALLALCAACGGPASNDAETSAALTSRAVNNAAILATGAKLVDNGVYRSGRPSDADLQTWASAGVRYVIDLETDAWTDQLGTDLKPSGEAAAVAHEGPAAKSLGLTWYWKPMSALTAVDDSRVNDILSILADPSKRPIVVHCHHGEDRTGLIIGLHRVFHDGWYAGDAYNEMLGDGFHQSLVLLNHYYETKTGWDDHPKCEWWMFWCH